MRLRPDLLSEDSPKGLEVVQLTTEPDVPSSHVYMEAQIFAPDSQRFVLHRCATPHGAMRQDPRHSYLLCDLTDHCSLTPLTEELGSVGPALSPDGQYLYYLVDQTVLGGGSVAVKRVKLGGSERETLTVLDQGIPGTGLFPSGIYVLSTISSDGQRLAMAAFLGDGQTGDAPFGLVVFDLTTGEAHLALQGPFFGNLHPQYSRSRDPEAGHDVMVQENHDNVYDAQGRTVRLVDHRLGGDIHLVRDDGTNLRDFPWGRDAVEFVQGHQCWRGRSEWAITSTHGEAGGQLIESTPLPHVGHIGKQAAGGRRNVLTRTLDRPFFFHFACDEAGRRIISDAGPQDDGGRIFLGDLGAPGEEPVRRWTFLLNPRSSWEKGAHVHPFLSPDGKTGFFNSDESGLLQAYMVTGLEGV